MTKAELKAFGEWCNDHFCAVFSYGFVLILAAVGALSVGINVSVFAGLVYVLAPALLWPVALLAVNQTILAVRYRTQRRLRLERELKKIVEREERVAALERSTGMIER